MLKTGRERERQRTFWTSNICTRSLLSSFVCTFQIARSIIRALRLAERGGGPHHALGRQFEDRAGFRSPSPRRKGRCLCLALGCLHFGIDWARHSSQQTSVGRGLECTPLLPTDQWCTVSVPNHIYRGSEERDELSSEGVSNIASFEIFGETQEDH